MLLNYVRAAYKGDRVALYTHGPTMKHLSEIWKCEEDELEYIVERKSMLTLLNDMVGSIAQITGKGVAETRQIVNDSAWEKL